MVQKKKKKENTIHPGILIGYNEVNHTAYKIYDTISNRELVLLRAVIFF